MADQIILTTEEQTKLSIINAVIQKQIKTGQAAKMLGITPRQIQRLKKAVKRDGLQAIIHKLKNKVGNHRIEISIKENILEKIKTHYYDFKPSFATEKLQEKQITVPTSQTVRIWMTEAGLWKTRKQKQTEYRS